MLFQNRGGAHTEGGKNYKKGDVVESDHDLDKMFPGKFSRVGVLPVADASLATSTVDEVLKDHASAKLAVQVAGTREARQSATATLEKPSKADKAKRKADLAAKSARGKDVTEEFPKATEEGFVVCRREKLFHVYEGDSAEPLNPSGLERDKVDAFVSEWLEG